MLLTDRVSIGSKALGPSLVLVGLWVFVVAAKSSPPGRISILLPAKNCIATYDTGRFDAEQMRNAAWLVFDMPLTQKQRQRLKQMRLPKILEPVRSGMLADLDFSDWCSAVGRAYKEEHEADLLRATYRGIDPAKVCRPVLTAASSALRAEDIASMDDFMTDLCREKTGDTGGLSCAMKNRSLETGHAAVATAWHNCVNSQWSYTFGSQRLRKLWRRLILKQKCLPSSKGNRK